jgi:hypothetical protein
LARCSPARFANDVSQGCAAILSGVGTWRRCL